jgi:glyoxylase-like metal-dependent hydrolase (beta-lactamase superfamily II)
MRIQMGLPVRDEWFEVREVEPGIRVITVPAAHALILSNTWLVLGRDRDLLVDTGNGLAPLRPFVDTLREDPAKPMVAVATHQHQDHAGGLWEFDERVAHALDAPEIEHPAPLIHGHDVWPAVAAAMAEEGFPVTNLLVTDAPSSEWDPDAFEPRGSAPTRLVTDGDVIELGDRAFRVLWLPGHTAGSIGLWDEADGTCFSGDAVYAGDPLIDEAPSSDVDDYVATMRRLRELPVRIVHAGHDDSMDRPAMIRRCSAYLERRAGNRAG